MSLIDSSGWIEYFMNGPQADRYARYLQKLSEVVTPTVVIYEVYKRIKSRAGEQEALLFCGQMEKTRLAPLSESIAYFAADLSLEHKLAMADAIVYATALLYEVPLITSDADFKHLPKVVYIS